MSVATNHALSVTVCVCQPIATPCFASLPQEGVSETGVSVAFTVLKCDAGPVLAQQHVAVGPDESAPQLLERCFRIGAGLLLEHLPDVWGGAAAEKAWAQDEAAATHAPKVRVKRERVWA
jgi:methionyl-tRNA formyltransferase